jgi:hypothetical protein
MRQTSRDIACRHRAGHQPTARSLHRPERIGSMVRRVVGYPSIASPPLPAAPLSLCPVPYEQGLSDWRVYSAEQAVGHDRNLTLEQCQQLVEEARASTWWHDWFPDAPPIEVVQGGDESPELGLRSSFAAPHSSYLQPTKWTISLHPQMQTTRVLLHGMAHCVQPRYVVEEIKNRWRRELVDDALLRRTHLTHGECFTAALAVITDNILPGDNGQLSTAFHTTRPRSHRPTTYECS